MPDLLMRITRNKLLPHQWLIRSQENKVKVKPSSTDPYDSSIDEEPDRETPDPPISPPLPAVVPDLPDFFEGKVLFLDGKFEADERWQLTRLIVAFEGHFRSSWRLCVQSGSTIAVRNPRRFSITISRLSSCRAESGLLQLVKTVDQ
ncbi:uncharacterized protein [Asterias amurensis]|uniref:uncharacterized protein n=1 Tax=Asterias amurensis TaxID=7602 RepID=UPI003AB1F4B2